MSTYNTYNVEKSNLGIDLTVAHGMAETAAWLDSWIDMHLPVLVR